SLRREGYLRSEALRPSGQGQIFDRAADTDVELAKNRIERAGRSRTVREHVDAIAVQREEPRLCVVSIRGQNRRRDERLGALVALPGPPRPGRPPAARGPPDRGG